MPLGEGRAADPVGPRTSSPEASADVVSPTLEMLGPERVTITDYKSSDVRDPVKARQRARDSLQLQIYAMGYEAMTGRLPDAVALHFLESGLVGEVAVDPKRLAKARGKIETAAAGMRARDYTPRPDYLACTYCAFRDICPSSVAAGDRAFASSRRLVARPPSSGLLVAGHSDDGPEAASTDGG